MKAVCTKLARALALGSALLAAAYGSESNDAPSDAGAETGTIPGKDSGPGPSEDAGGSKDAGSTGADGSAKDSGVTPDASFDGGGSQDGSAGDADSSDGGAEAGVDAGPSPVGDTCLT